MKKMISRRDFMKYAGAATVGAAAMVTLGACGSSSDTTTTAAETAETTTAAATEGSTEGEIVAEIVNEHDEVTDVISAVTSELNTFMPYYVGMPNMLTNNIDTLLTVDRHNNVQPLLAESWEGSDDEKDWTFHIRQGATWVDYQGNYKADVVAEDWIYALEWISNFWKNDSYMTTIPFSCIIGCQDYYNYTQNMTEDEAMDLDIDEFLDMCGIEAPDDYTVVYHCPSAIPYFESLATAIFTMPLSKSLIDEVGGPRNYKGVTPYTMWYCGPYMFSEFIEDSTKTMVPNPAYWDTTCKRFDSWTYVRTESTDTAWQLFELGTINSPSMSSATLETIIRDETDPWHDYICLSPSGTVIWGLYFNYAKKNISDDTMDTDWNKAAANENFRQAFYYGLDLYNYAATWDSVEPEVAIRGTMTSAGIASLSDGTDYASYVMSLTGFNPNENWSHHDAALGEEYKAKAMEELEAEGVTFPIHMDIWAGSSQDSQNTYTILKETLEDGLGTDFVEVEIHTYITSKTSEVYNTSYMSVEVQGYGALFCDPTTYLTMLCNDMNGNAEYADLYGHIAECENQEIIDQIAEFTQMMRDADAITGDHDARLKALADAEAFAIDHVLVFPTVTNASRGITFVNEYTKPSMANDTQKMRNVNLETNADYYTTEEYDAIREAYYAEVGV